MARASENDYRKQEIEILVSRRYPWIMLDKLQTSIIAIFILLMEMVVSLMFIFLI